MQERGFTLIELLVVVSIITVLLAMLTPAMDKAILQAELVVCGSNLRAMGGAQHRYSMENRNLMTRFTRDNFGENWNGGDGVTDTHKGTWYHWPADGSQQSMLAYYDVEGYAYAGYHTGSTHLYFADLLRNVDAYYCAADQRRKSGTPNDGSHDSAGFFLANANYHPNADNKVLSSYAWNPMMTFSTRKRFTRLWQDWERGSPADNTSTSKGIMAMDVLYDQFHGSSHAPYYNLVHFDGSVGQANVPEFVELNKTAGWVYTYDSYYDYIDTLLRNE